MGTVQRLSRETAPLTVTAPNASAPERTREETPIPARAEEGDQRGERGGVGGGDATISPQRVVQRAIQQLYTTYQEMSRTIEK